MRLSFKKYLFTPFVQIAVLIIVAILLQSNVLRNQFAVDDGVAYANNAYVKKGVWGWKEVLTRPYFEGERINDPKKMAAQSDLPGDRWRPLLLLIFAVEREFFGNNPLGGHVLSLVFLALNIVVIYVFLKQYVFKRDNDFRAFWATLLFALLPIHAEVIANIKSQDELLCLFFAVLSILFSFKYVSGKWYNLLFMLVSYTLSLFVKESALTFFFVIPLTLYFFSGATKKQLLLIGSLLLICFGVYLYLRFQVTGVNFKPSKALYNDPYLLANFEQKWTTIIYVNLYNLGLLVYPVKYAWDYQYNVFPYLSWTHPKFLISLFMLATFAIIALLGFRKKSILSYALIFFAANFVLVNNMVVNLGSYLDERCLYLPSIGYVIFAVTILSMLYHYLLSRIGRRLTFAIYLLVFVPYSVLCINKFRERNADWYNSFTLFKDGINFPENGKLQRSAASTYISFAISETQQRQYYPASCNAYIDSAEIYLRRAVRIYPDDKQSKNDLAAVYDFKTPGTDSFTNALLQNGILVGESTEKIATLYQLIAQPYIYGKGYSTADSLMKIAYKLNAYDVQVAYNYALSAFYNQRYSAALDAAQKAITLDNKDNFATQKLYSAIVFKLDSIQAPKDYERLHKEIHDIQSGKVNY